ncbi:Ankyrin repeat-containing protein [Glarea lozoyensis ATCC 20868]|uniref:Ankyrin repeat-containing protein n=1 Tax=Glarea lozoyensis (strain ATCC 20868 / MF5171) TaxID=1116229 RepID=S3DMP8_GLAL2|nr:Ankyrin repeat-containing protein [Glarea lozoyensis ATCC 20868]EPE33356.1 Ankyrin repeat-containing protein [Glarea lozoyensis ATCC 20868]
MTPNISEDEIDDLIYFARTGEVDELNSLNETICQRESISSLEFLDLVKDENSGNGVLHMAAANGHDKILLDLCKALSNPSPQTPAMLAIINSQNKAGNTPLHWAALNGHLESVKVLLDNGADPTRTNQRGHDAVYEAELNDKKEVVEWVLKEGGEGLEEGVVGETGEGRADESADEDMQTDETDGVKDEELLKRIGEQLGHLGIQDADPKT